MKRMLLMIAIIFLYGCSNKNITNELRLKYALNDTSKTFEAYRGIKLGSNVSFWDSLIKIDTQSHNINGTQLYRNRESIMYIKHGLIESLYVFNEICTQSEIDYWGLSKIEKKYECQIKRLLENLQEEPAYQSIFLDYLLNENCYRTSMILPITNELDKSEYIELDGWFSYEGCNNRIFELTCVFDKYIDNENLLKNIVDSFLSILSKKYGKSYNLCDNINLNLNCTNKFAWLIGGYEVQFFCNCYRINNNTDGKYYEFIVRYIDNKFIHSEEKKRTEQKNMERDSVEEKYNQEQKELKKKLQDIL